MDDRVDVALAVDADGVHVGQDDVEVADVRRIAPGLLVGASAGTLAELEAVVAGAPDYIGVGPVYPTPSKADAGDAMGLSGLRAMIAAVHAHNLPVVAIGGITQRNAAAVWAAGVDGMATISAVMGAPSWLEACRGLRASDPAAKIRPQRD